ncbi:HNH endonuclease [Mangrovicoccus ximenensis]|uniref:HNH endonuclease n=1 Tax=Mangrovicoccus ximenensis TaxID=1911570 RepID=UPI002ED21BB5
MCHAPAQVVDHIQPHRGDQSLFWDVSNWQALCKCCHDREKQRQERTNRSRPVSTLTNR